MQQVNINNQIKYVDLDNRLIYNTKDKRNGKPFHNLTGLERLEIHLQTTKQ